MPLLTITGGGYGWRWSFAAFALVALAGPPIVVKALPHDGPLPQDRFQPGNVLTSYRPIRGHRPSLGLIAGAFLRGVACTGVMTCTGAFFIDKRGLSTGSAGFVYAAGGGHTAVRLALPLFAFASSLVIWLSSRSG